MKRQRNTQQVKEHEKCPPNQTKEEEIGNLPEKEFRIIIIKMIQNLENKIELQINSLETNNIITEIKNTLERINSRISEAEEQISELEDKIVEITSEEQNKKNENNWG